MILLVDDNEELLAAYTEILEAHQYQVIACSSPIDALHKFQSHKADISTVISDYCMPHMTGSQLLQSIIKEVPSINAIICTGFKPDNISSQIKVLTKPFSIKTLIQTIETF